MIKVFYQPDYSGYWPQASGFRLPAFINLRESFGKNGCFITFRAAKMHI